MTNLINNCYIFNSGFHISQVQPALNKQTLFWPKKCWIKRLVFPSRHQSKRSQVTAKEFRKKNSNSKYRNYICLFKYHELGIQNSLGQNWKGLANTDTFIFRWSCVLLIVAKRSIRANRVRSSTIVYLFCTDMSEEKIRRFRHFLIRSAYVCLFMELFPFFKDSEKKKLKCTLNYPFEKNWMWVTLTLRFLPRTYTVALQMPYK